MAFWNVVKMIFGKIWEFIKPSVNALATAAGQKLSEIALNAVKDLSISDLTNDEKRKAAFDKIVADAKQQGIEAGDSLINLAIEMAVQKIKDASE